MHWEKYLSINIHTFCTQHNIYVTLSILLWYFVLLGAYFMNKVLVIKNLKYLHLEDGEREVGYYIMYLTHISQFLTNLYDITKSQLRYNNMDELIRCSAIFSPLSIQSFIHPSIHSSVQTASNLSITLPAFFSVLWNNWHAHVWKWLNLWQKSMKF